jgi:thioredoxin-like negative regulator of GroEL
MNTLLFLSADDFQLTRINAETTIMKHPIQGFSLVLFYSAQCEYSRRLIPIFNQMPESLSGCYFAMINVTTAKNRKIINMSQQSNTTITHVPLIILYFNGEPCLRYDGDNPTIQDLSKFVLDVSNSFYQQNAFNQNTKKIPAFTIGVPVCGDDGVCYLDYDKAY